MKKYSRIQFQKGFTLAEILAALAISLLVAGGAIALYQTGQKAYRTGNQELEVLQNGRVILDKISRELRQSNEIVTDLPADETSPPATQIIFQDGHITQIQYLTYYLEANQIHRKITHYFFDDPNVWVNINARDTSDPPKPPNEAIDDDQVVAEYITKFELYGDKVITINISCSNKGQNVNYQTSIWPRNL